MGSNDVVSIRVKALGVSITIADGSIAIEQTRTEIPVSAAVPKVESPAAATSGAVPASAGVAERVAPFSKGVNDSGVRGDSRAGNGLPGDSGKGQEARSSQTKPVWSDDEVEKLRALTQPTQRVP
jgi:hypothetical protein